MCDNESICATSNLSGGPLNIVLVAIKAYTNKLIPSVGWCLCLAYPVSCRCIMTAGRLVFLSRAVPIKTSQVVLTDGWSPVWAYNLAISVR